MFVLWLLLQADSLCVGPVKWTITSGIISIIFNACVKAENPQIKSVQHRNHGVRHIHSIHVLEKGVCLTVG